MKSSKIGFYWLLNGESYDFNTPVSDSVTLITEWTDLLYTVTFNADNGTPAQTQAVAYEAKVTKPNDSIKLGHAFLGWFIPGATAPYDYDAPVTADIILVAHWEKIAGIVARSKLLAQARLESNPVGDLLVLSGVAAAERVEVYSLMGARIHMQLLDGRERVAIQAHRWAAGKYAVRLVAGDGVVALLFVKQ